VTTPDDPKTTEALAPEPADAETAVAEPTEEEAPPPTRGRSLGLEAIDRYLPAVAVIGMVATYLQVAADFALIVIALVWLVATRLTRSRRFLGLTLTEALAWDATVLIFLLLVFNALAAAAKPA
jgi:hypothetical protein